MPKKNLKTDSRRANDGNPNNVAFWLKHGYKNRPENWRELSRTMKPSTSSKNRSGKREFGGSFIGFDSYGPLPADGFGRLSSDDY